MASALSAALAGRAIRGFGRDARGSVALQTIIFSLLLFTLAGLVLESGRIFAEHSEMQGFADEMALAAAGELDGTDDAIERASGAVFGFAGADPVMASAGLRDGVGFAVESVAFYATMRPSASLQNDMREAFPADDALAVATGTALVYPGGDPAAASTRASHAVVLVRQERARSLLARIVGGVVALPGAVAARDSAAGADTAEDGRSSDALEISAIAAAAMQRTACADLSTVVLCNPREASGTPSDAVSRPIAGRTMVYIAPGAPDAAEAGAGAGPKDLAHLLFRLAPPQAGPARCPARHPPGTGGGVPEPEEGETGATPTGIVERGERCPAARPESGAVCWGPDRPLRIAPADAATAGRALAAVFPGREPPYRFALAGHGAPRDAWLGTMPPLGPLAAIATPAAAPPAATTPVLGGHARLRVALVDCGAAVASGAGGAAGRFEDAGSRAIDPAAVSIVEVALPAPPTGLCGAGRIGCTPAASLGTWLRVDVLGEADADAVRWRLAPRLVR